MSGQKRFNAYVVAPSFETALSLISTKFPEGQVTCITKMNHDPKSPVHIYDGKLFMYGVDTVELDRPTPAHFHTEK